MFLKDLDAHFLGHSYGSSFYELESIEGAQGVRFQCPECSKGKEQKEGFVIGAHSITCWFSGRVRDTITPGPGRWVPSGTTIDTLSLSPLVDCGCWHGYVKDGNAE